jgi:hypothetical protein
VVHKGKVKTAPLTYYTVKRFDFSGKGFLKRGPTKETKVRYYLKAYTDVDGSVINHTVVTELETGNFISQYPLTLGDNANAWFAVIDSVGERVAGRQSAIQEDSEAKSGVEAPILPNSTSKANLDARQNIDTTGAGNVQPQFAQPQRKPTSSLSRALLGASEEARKLLSESTYISSTDQINDDAAQSWVLGITGQKGATLEDAASQLQVMKGNQFPPLTPPQQTLAKAHIAERYGRLIKFVSDDISKSRNFDQQPLLDFYRAEHIRLLNELQEQGSIAGQDLQIFAKIANIFHPIFAVRSYTNPFTKTQRTELDKDGTARTVKTAMDEAVADGVAATLSPSNPVIQKINSVAAKKSGITQPTVNMAQGIFDFFFQVDRNLGGTGFPVTEDIAQKIAEGIVKRAMPKTSLSSKGPTPYLDELFKLAKQRVESEIAPLVALQQGKTAEESIRDGVSKMIKDYGIADSVQRSFEAARGQLLNNPDAVLTDEARKALESYQFDTTALRGAELIIRNSLDMRDLVTRTLKEQNAAIEDVIEKLKTDFKLEGKTAEVVAGALKSRFVAEARKSAAAKLAGLVREKKVSPKLSTSERLLRLINVGGFSEEQFYNALAKQFRLPHYNEETVARLQAEAERIQNLPKNSDVRNEATIKLMGDIAEGARQSLVGFEKWKFILGDLAPAIWQSSILSGPPTHMVNYMATLANIAAQSFSDATGFALAARNNGGSVQDMMRFYSDILAGFSTTYLNHGNAPKLLVKAAMEASRSIGERGGAFREFPAEVMNNFVKAYSSSNASGAKIEALRAFVTGTSRYKNAKLEDVSLMERLATSESMVDRMLSGYKWVGRVMLATDAVNSGTAQEIRMRHAMRYAAMVEGKKGQDLEKAILDSFDPPKEVLDAIETQVTKEEAEGVFNAARDPDIAKRIRREELIEQRRGQDVLEQAQDTAGRWTFNGDPKGAAGFIFDGLINGMNRKLKVTKFLFPFMRTMGNLIDASLDFTPGIGQLRAYNVRASRVLGADNKYAAKIIERGSPEFFAQQTRAWMGTLAFSAILAAAIKGLEDEEEGKDPFFAVYGAGPEDKFKREQLRTAGWQANSIKIGDRFLRFTDWPALNIGLAAIGSISDYARNSRDLDTPIPTKIGLAMLGTASALMEKNMLGGMSNLVTAMANPDQRGLNALSRQAVSPIAGVTNPPLAQWLRNTLFFNEEGKVAQLDRSGFDGLMHSIVPFSIGADKALNVLGEPIEEYWYGATTRRFGYFNTVDEHPVTTPLAKAGLFVPSPSKNTTIEPLAGKRMSLARAGDEAWRAFLVYRGDALKTRLGPSAIRLLTGMEREAAQTMLDGPDYKGYATAIAQRKVERDIRSGKIKVP